MAGCLCTSALPLPQEQHATCCHLALASLAWDPPALHACTCRIRVRHLAPCVHACVQGPAHVPARALGHPPHAVHTPARPAGVAGHAHRQWGDEFTERAIVVRVVALVMLFLSILIAVWAGLNFQRRAIFLE